MQTDGIINMEKQNEHKIETEQVMDTYSNDDRQYLQMMQEIITRMANNSANCKSWMVTLVAAFCAIGCGIDALNGWIIIAVIPVIVFWYLDTFYLNLERKMRNRELDFILIMKDNHGSNAYKNAIYNFAPMPIDTLTEEQKTNGYVKTSDRAFSKSILPFYLWMIIAVVIISIVLNWTSILKLFSK